MSDDELLKITQQKQGDLLESLEKSYWEARNEYYLTKDKYDEGFLDGIEKAGNIVFDYHNDLMRIISANKNIEDTFIYSVIKKSISGWSKEVVKLFKHYNDALAYVNSMNPGTQYIYIIEETELC